MARGLTDEPELPNEPDQNQSELDAVISSLIMGQNKLHDRIIDLERRLDHMANPHIEEQEAADRKRWRRGL